MEIHIPGLSRIIGIIKPKSQALRRLEQVIGQIDAKKAAEDERIAANNAGINATLANAAARAEKAQSQLTHGDPHGTLGKTGSQKPHVPFGNSKP